MTQEGMMAEKIRSAVFLLMWEGRKEGDRKPKDNSCVHRNLTLSPQLTRRTTPVSSDSVMTANPAGPHLWAQTLSPQLICRTTSVGSDSVMTAIPQDHTCGLAQTLP